MTWHNLRQQSEKADDRFNLCLADFVAPKDSGIADYVGAFAVTTGLGVEAREKAFEAAHDDYNAIMLKALADRLADLHLGQAADERVIEPIKHHGHRGAAQVKLAAR